MTAVGARQLRARRATVAGTDPAAVADALARAVGPEPATLVVAFASWRLDPDAMAAALAHAFGDAVVIGCTSYGEIADGAIREGAATVVALGGPGLRAGVALAPGLARHALGASRAAVIEAAAGLGLDADALDPRRHVAITLVDGSCGVEESFCLGSAATAPQIRFVGGSASCAVEPAVRPRVFFGGRAHGDAGVVAVLEPGAPFAVIESEHMVPTAVRTVVTGADHRHRLVRELDGFPAARRYQQLIAAAGGTETVDGLVASSYPFATYVGGRPYVRSVLGLEGDALRFASAVEVGAVLRLMRAGDLVGSTEAALAAAAAEVGDPALVLAFSCLGRHFEATTRTLQAPLAAIYGRVPLVGFHSFGEQAGSLLVNHTLTGLALGGGAGG